MKQFRLQKPAGSGVTIIKNTFIDRYMPEANGEFVKIYLYLLRCLPLDMDLSVSSIADIFDHTEKDVLRALAYWEKQGLLLLTRDKEGEITGITFLETASDETAVGGTTEPARGSRCPMEQSRAAREDRGNAFSATQDPWTEAGAVAAAAEPAARVLPKKQPLSADRIAELKKQEDIEQLLFIAAQYIGRPLTTAEISDILYYYDSLHFSADLIEYLVEYCVSKGKKSRQYMEKVALGWAADGIGTVQEAKNSTNLYSKKYYSVLNAFGIKNRGPAAVEKEFIDRWTDEYGFTMPLITEACNRTIAQTHEASFPYADSILTDWYKKGVHHLEDIASLDTQRARKKKNTAPGPAQNNKFNNFHQRDYDFEQLEKDLLNS